MAIELNSHHNPQDDDEGATNGIATLDILNPDGSDDDDDSSSVTSSGLTELEADEFPGHFREHAGRLFHSHGDLPYPLPVDGTEQAVCFISRLLVNATRLIQCAETQRAAQDTARFVEVSLCWTRCRGPRL